MPRTFLPLPLSLAHARMRVSGCLLAAEEALQNAVEALPEDHPHRIHLTSARVDLERTREGLTESFNSYLTRKGV